MKKTHPARSIMVGCRPVVTLVQDLDVLYRPGPAIYAWRLVPIRSKEGLCAGATRCILPLPDKSTIPSLCKDSPSKRPRCVMVDTPVMEIRTSQKVYHPSQDLGSLHDHVQKHHTYTQRMCDGVAAARSSAGTPATANTGQTIQPVVDRMRSEAQVCSTQFGKNAS